MDSSSPLEIERIEWFASAADLCRAMDWLRSTLVQAGQQGRPGLDILAINKGLSFRKPYWKYIGYKGGSETGVLNLTWLLQKSDGRWYALSTGWNDPHARLDEEKFFGLLQSLIILLEN